MNSLTGAWRSPTGALHRRPALTVVVHAPCTLLPQWHASALSPVVKFSDQSNGTGGITPALGDLNGLTYLDVSSNSLDGDLPLELGTLSQLAYFGGADNSFTGNVPWTFSALTALTRLDLHSNALSGMT